MQLEKIVKNYFYNCLNSTELGNIHFIASDEALLALAFDATIEQYLSIFKIDRTIQKTNSIILLAQKEINEYIKGSRRKFTVPLYFEGTTFQKTVWNYLLQIPFGIQKTYMQQAIDLGMKMAIRAIASANGKNPISIIIPCHRILRTDGTLGGYSGGLNIKNKLLQLEAKSNYSSPQSTSPAPM